jgi:hypothetical protein
MPRGTWALVVAALFAATIPAARSADPKGGAVAFDPPIRLEYGARTADVVVADVTGDGVNDVVRVPTEEARVVVHPGRGDGTFGPAFDVYTTAIARRARAARLNADAAFDLVLWRDGDSAVEALLSDGAGRFAQSAGTVAPAGIASPADWNGDGVIDLVTLDRSGVLRARLGDGVGGFGPPSATSLGRTGTFMADLVVADLDADGVVDVAAIDGRSLRFFWRSPAGPPVEGALVEPGDGVANWFPTSGEVRGALAVGDVDGDGLPDLVATGDSYRQPLAGLRISTTQATVFRHVGPRSLRRWWSSVYDAPKTFPSLALADVTGDDVPDLATPAAVLVGRGDGTFGPAMSAATPGARVALGDASGDGRADFVYGESLGMFGVSPLAASASAPTVTSMSPAVLHPEAQIDVVLEGTGISPGALVDFGDGMPIPRPFAREVPQLLSPEGLPIWLRREVLQVADPQTTPTSLRVSVRVSADAAPGPRVLTLVNPDGGTASIPFEIADAGDGLAFSVTPERAHRGEELNVVVRGRGFVPGASVLFTRQGATADFHEIAVRRTDVLSSRELRLSLAIGPGAAAGPQRLVIVNGTGVGTFFDGVFRVLAPGTISLDVSRGLLRPSARRGVFSASGTIAFGDFDPATDASEVRWGELTNPHFVRIPAGGAGWRVRGGRFTWTSPRRETPRVRLVLDRAKGTFRLDVARADIFPPAATELGVDLTLGVETAASTADWTERASGAYALRPAKPR